ncbi:phospholipase D-like domain-containing protein [Halorubellus litoreus]|uniref:Phosphatidylserine/phosphatidylglycerophosphate/ cardiolipin synthase family protein n=1 Tax=Halorubellus litoreus TaxID=755308 RepID=A0ABD5VHU1_9EURY
MSRRRALAIALVWLLVAPAIATGTGPGPVGDVESTSAPAAAFAASGGVSASSLPGAPGKNESGPRVAAVYPNPVADGDAGEYVLLSFPERTHVGDWALTDGETTVSLPNRTVSGFVLVAANVSAARRLRASASASSHARANESDGSEASGPHVPGVTAAGFALSNGGERLVLARPNGATAHAVAYEDAPEGERYVDGTFRALGATDHAPATAASVDARAFVTPDVAVPLEPIRNASTSVSLAGYTFASERVATALGRAADRGVDVRVLVDDAPVGGVTRRQVNVLEDLADAGITVRALGGDRARYDYHHAKYLVADDVAVVLTENWKPSGTGGHANRGWGVVLRDAETASALEDVFEGDWTAPDARNWTTVTVDAGDPATRPANATYPTRVRSRNVTAERVTVLVAPDNAEAALTARLRNATDRVHVLQMTATRDGVLVRETIAAARRGVDVRILLSSAWYAREENQAVVDALNAIADRESLPLDARLVDPDGRFRKVHAKGVVVDDTVVLGSINWNDHSLRENREVAVALHGDAVADYYADALDRDWQGGTKTPLPTWLAAATALAVLVLLAALARRIHFEN